MLHIEPLKYIIKYLSKRSLCNILLFLNTFLIKHLSLFLAKNQQSIIPYSSSIRKIFYKMSDNHFIDEIVWNLL
jgi:hypothetical protein